MKDEPALMQDENTAVETILEGNDEDIGKLLAKQPSLADFVQDVQSVKEGLKLIEDEEPPPLLLERIMSKNKRSLFSRLQDLPLEWYKNPFILCFGFVLAILFLYFFIVFLF